jgi:uncharacterized SAM-binding protein YcdF (DUF218 family)
MPDKLEVPSAKFDKFNLIAKFLALRGKPLPKGDLSNPPVDLAVLLGSSLVQPIFLAAEIIKTGVAKKLLISGGIGHSTQGLRDSVDGGDFSGIKTSNRAEANIIADILILKLGVDPGKIIIENRSTNCGTNAEESRRVLGKSGHSPKRILLIQDPTMQRRSHACFERAWSDRPEVSVESYAPFVPSLEVVEGATVVGGSDYPSWSPERLASLTLGEIPRLRDDENGYGPRGKNFFEHIEIPKDVQQAFEELSDEAGDVIRQVPA